MTDASIENKSVSSVESSPRRLSRRTVLKEALGVLGTVIASSIPDVLQPKPVILHQEIEDPFASTMNVDELKSLIEKDFQVELLPGGNAIPVTDMPITVPWGGEDLRKLARALSELPQYFYEPRQRGEEKRKFRIGLSPDKGECFCGGHPDLKDIIVLKQEFHRTGSFLDDRNFQGIEYSLFQVVHEFTHAVTMSEIERYARVIIEPLEIGEEGLHELFSSQLEWPSQYRYAYELPSPYVTPMIVDLPQAYYERPEDYVVIDSNVIVPKSDYFTLGKKYFQKRASEFSKYFADGPRLFSAKSLLSSKTRLGYSARNAGEFFSVAAETYVRGLDYFVKVYQPFLGRERAEKLYNGMKQEIFRSREY